MRATVLKLIQLVSAIASLISWGNYAIARASFMRDGRRVSDSLHAIELDQHGSISYITKHQSHVLALWVACSIACFLVAAVIGARGRLRQLVKR
jgi:hypothetical protein